MEPRPRRGLAHLEGLAKLKSLYLWETKVTDEGVKKLQEKLPMFENHPGSVEAVAKPGCWYENLDRGPRGSVRQRVLKPLLTGRSQKRPHGGTIPAELRESGHSGFPSVGSPG